MGLTTPGFLHPVEHVCHVGHVLVVPFAARSCWWSLSVGLVVMFSIGVTIMLLLAKMLPMMTMLICYDASW